MNNPMYHRASIREFLPDSVSEENIRELLKAGMNAPSAINQQPWEFFVVTDIETKDKLAAISMAATPAKRAPLVIVPCIRKDCKRIELAPLDLSAATENILLQADVLGLGGVWLCVYPREEKMSEVHSILGMDENLIPFAMIAIGHPVGAIPSHDRYDEGRIHRK
ncbi:MAG: nitroreductase family protein [Bacilli bacterium]|nr:nitroreductase family protein [Bacilli bacterium]